MKFFLLTLWIICSLSLAADRDIQSQFTGPVALSVWQHWQPSRNVERDLSFPADFVLTRFFERSEPATPKAYLELKLFKFKEAGLRARFSGTAYWRAGDYGTEHRSVDAVEAQGEASDTEVIFKVPAPQFLDAPGGRIVTAIEFEVFRGEERLYHYRLLPMYVRGSRNHYWNHVIDPVLAHSGNGRIGVANGLSAETGLDLWEGRLVRPTLNFVDRNTLGAGSAIGWHRHERNQEMWLVEAGEVEVTHGVARRVSEDYLAPRQWDSSGEIRQVAQFNAKGGWVETRRLLPGEFSVIVPNPEDPQTVCFHALVALTDAQTFTMGTKN